MRSRKTMFFPILILLMSMTPYLGAAEQNESEKVAPDPAPAQVPTSEPAPPVELDAAVAPEAPSAPDAFLDETEITTMTPAHTIFCRCLVGVNCCGDPGVDIACGTRRGCICNAQDECIRLHVHIP